MTDHVIYKYTLPSEAGTIDVEMPEGAIMLHATAVNDVVCFWARVNPDNAMVKRTMMVVAAGKRIAAENLGGHVGTAVTINGRLVWHVFDLGVAP